jgi:hypothetical protein
MAAGRAPPGDHRPQLYDRKLWRRQDVERWAQLTYTNAEGGGAA